MYWEYSTFEHLYFQGELPLQIFFLRGFKFHNASHLPYDYRTKLEYEMRRSILHGFDALMLHHPHRHVYPVVLGRICKDIEEAISYECFQK